MPYETWEDIPEDEQERLLAVERLHYATDLIAAVTALVMPGNNTAQWLDAVAAKLREMKGREL